MNEFNVLKETAKFDGLYEGATYCFIIKEAGKRKCQKEGIYYGYAPLSCICVLSESGEVSYYKKSDIISYSLAEKQLDLPIEKAIEVLEEYVQSEAEDGNVLLCAALDVAIKTLNEKAKAYEEIIENDSQEECEK